MRKANPERAVRDLAQQIRKARVAAGLTQERAAELADVPYKRWQAIEGHGANVTFKTLVRVAAALKHTVSTLTGIPVERRARSPSRRHPR